MRNLFLQFIKFLGVSGIGWLLDVILYSLLIIVSDDLFVNNFITSFISVTFVFFFSVRFVFCEDTGRTLYFKYIAYLVYQCVLIFFISYLLLVFDFFIKIILIYLEASKFSFIISKILITPITMILNFFVMKFITRKHKN